MNVIEITRQLGAELQKTPEFINYSLAKANNDDDEMLQNMIGEFNLVRMQLSEELNRENKDDAKVAGLNDKLRDIYGRVMQNESMSAFTQAKNELDALVKRIYSVLAQCAEGDDPATAEPIDESSCSGDCSSCGGCH